jgi:hypothetical protein
MKPIGFLNLLRDNPQNKISYFHFWRKLGHVHHWNLRRYFYKSPYLIIINAKYLSQFELQQCQLVY